MSRKPSYTDAELASAVACAHSWRGVLRALGLTATSGSAMRSVRRMAERLELDHSHFTGQRRWSDGQLDAAVRTSDSWSQVAATLGLAGDSSSLTLKAHARRLGLPTDHLDPRPVLQPKPPVPHPNVTHVPRAGSALAAAWFLLCGHEVSWPLEPCRYDLIVALDRLVKVQVKTTTVRASGTWLATLSSTAGGRRVYDPDDIDYFFIIDGDLTYYLIPVSVVGGLHAIHLAAYERYRLPTQAGERTA